MGMSLCHSFSLRVKNRTHPDNHEFPISYKNDFGCHFKLLHSEFTHRIPFEDNPKFIQAPFGGNESSLDKVERSSLYKKHPLPHCLSPKGFEFGS